MHKDVDLTEKGYFQDYKLPNYNHRQIRKRVPWCRNVDNGAFFARYKNKLNSFLNESYYIYDYIYTLNQYIIAFGLILIVKSVFDENISFSRLISFFKYAKRK